MCIADCPADNSLLAVQYSFRNLSNAGFALCGLSTDFQVFRSSRVTSGNRLSKQINRKNYFLLCNQKRKNYFYKGCAMSEISSINVSIEA
jgi:hypothetical protein